MSKRKTAQDREPRSNPEIEARLLEAHHRGAPIEDLEYGEVTGLLDIVLTRAKQATEEATERVRAASKVLRDSSSTLRRTG